MWTRWGGFDQYTQQENVSFISYATADEANQAMIDKTIKEYMVIQRRNI